MWVRGLKQRCILLSGQLVKSHPMWVRGLKHYSRVHYGLAEESHPMWVRGLKHINSRITYYKYLVAPHVGAWIETPSAYAQR